MVKSSLSEPIQQQVDIADLMNNSVPPLSVTSLCIHRAHPAVCGRRLDFLQRIVAFRFQDQVQNWIGLQTDKVIRHVVVHLPVVQICDCKIEPRVFDESVCQAMAVNLVRG
jgi:hypothetical protein